MTGTSVTWQQRVLRDRRREKARFKHL